MIVPFAAPRDRELVNLSQIVRFVQHPAGVRCIECSPSKLNGGNKAVIHETAAEACTIYFSDGKHTIYTGQNALNLNNEIAFALSIYRDWQTAAVTAKDGGPVIVTPDATGRMM